MKKLFLIIILTIFLIGNAHALWIDSNFIKDAENKTAVTNYGIYEIDEYAWYDILKIWKPTRIKEVTLIENTEYCGSNCYAIKEFTNYKPAPLIEDIRFYRDFGDGKWIEWDGFTNWEILIENKNRYMEQTKWISSYIDTNETDIKTGEPIKELSIIRNGTEIIDTGEWLPYDWSKEDYNGTYKIKLKGTKKPSTRLDWEIKVNEIWTTEWAVWGNISEGDDGEITLNSPEDEYISLINLINFNGTANITGATLTNTSLWDNSTGSWELNQTQSLFGYYEYLDYYNMAQGSDGWLTTHSFTGQDLIDGGMFEGQSFNWSSTISCTGPSEYESCRNAGQMKITLDGEDVLTLPQVHYGDGWETYQDTIDEVWTSSSSFAILGRRDDRNLQGGETDTINNTWTSINISEHTEIFEKNISGDILWNIQACDSDGDCGFASENRTLSLDTTSPSITIEYPTSTINYGEDEKTETLNVTFTDGNLDSCWYNYNGTNISIEGCQSGVKNSTTFTLNEGNYNITLYSNDSIGNLNTTFFEWEYSIFGNDVEYDTQVYETAIATFTLNITYDTSQDIDAVINYDEENYTTQNIGTESEGIFQNTLSIPTIAESSNKTFFWYLLINDSIVATTEETNQTINQIILTHCNDTYTNQSLNFTVFDEINATEINTTSNPLTFQATFNYWVGDGDVKKNYSYSQVSGTNNSFQFCIYPYNASNYDFKTDMDAKFSATDFYENNYYLRNSTLTNISSNITLYLLLEDEATKFYITVQEGVSALTDAIITVAKYFVGEGSYKTIGIKETDNQGKFTIYLDEDEEYQYSVVKEGILYAILEETASCSATPCEITLQVDGEQGDIWEGYNSYFANNTLSNLSFNPDTKIVTYTFVDITGLANYFRLEVRQSNMNTTTGRIICDSPLYSSSGRLTCNVTGYDGNFFARGYISRSPEKLDQVISFVINTIQENLGIMGALFSLGVIITVVFAFGTVSRGNPSAILMGLGLSLLILKLMTFLPLGWITLSVIELAILYLSKLTKS